MPLAGPVELNDILGIPVEAVVCRQIVQLVRGLSRDDAESPALTGNLVNKNVRTSFKQIMCVN
jgi:hypothetical protein